MIRWHRDLPWRTPVRFAAMGVSDQALGFIREFGMEQVRPAAETADGHALFARTFDSEASMFEVVAAARAVADRKGRPIGSER